MDKINWYPGHMAKARRLIKEKLDFVDIVFEVIDARMPYSSKIQDLDVLVKNKPRLIVMTKTDLCDQSETAKWVDYYEKKGIKVIGVDLEHNPNLNKVVAIAKDLMSDINDKRAKRGMISRRAHVLIVGIPNAGKSTLINRLVGRRATNVANKPGVTKGLDWIRINDDLELLDTPGILWPNLEDETVALNLATFTAIKEEILPTSRVAVYIVEMLAKHYPNTLKTRYGIEDISNMEEALELIGRKRGCLVRGGHVDIDKVYTLILTDVKNGSIKNITFDRFDDEAN